MKSLFPAGMLRFLFPVLLGTTGILSTACKKDAVSTAPDYSAIDEGIIKKYLDDNKITTAQRQSSGLYYLPVVSAPTAQQAVAGKYAYVLYTGRFMDGRIFDASSQHGNTPISFILGRGQVIAGWDEGIALMRKGEKAELFIPSALAYGAAGAGTSIPPNTVLHFEVELVDVR